MCGMSAALHPTIALLQSNSLASVVQQEIERAILAGEYAPGSKLLEAALAEKMGVSRGPVREAFRILDSAYLDSYGNQLGLVSVRLYETPNNWADAIR